MTEPLRKPDSPCLGFCTTAPGDDVRRSCGRTFEEVCDWIHYSEAEKEACWKRLQEEGWIDAEHRPLKGRIA